MGATLMPQDEPFSSAEARDVLLKTHLALVQAKTAWDVVSALRICADPDADLQLLYLDVDEAGAPTAVTKAAHLHDGTAWDPSVTVPASAAPQDCPLIAELGAQQDPVWFCEEVPAVLRRSALLGRPARLVAFKLLGAGHIDRAPRWHAILAITWAQTRPFTRRERYLYTSLWETLSVVVSNQRLHAEALEHVRRLREIDRLKDEFLHTLSHELRTPLSGIITAADLILNGLHGEISDRVRRDVEAMAQSGEHLLNVVNDVLDMASIEAGTFRLHLEALDVDNVIRESLQDVRPVAEAKGLQLKASLEAALPNPYADRRRVRQVLINLLSNALKFTGHGTIEVGAYAAQGMIVVHVRDDGIGIRPEHHRVIFEKFRQVDGTLTRAAEGTGLGLPISKGIVEQHGGRMWMQSEVGAGSCFYFSLPVAIGEHNENPVHRGQSELHQDDGQHRGASGPRDANRSHRR